MGARNGVRLHQWMLELSHDSLAAVKPVANEPAVVPPGGERSKLMTNLDAVRPVSSLRCACRMHEILCGGSREKVKP